MNFKILLTAGLIVATSLTQAQNSNKAFAITSDGNQDFIWMNIRQVDLGTGLVSKTIFEKSKTNYILTDVVTKKSTTQLTDKTANIYQSKDYPTGSMVAAAAYDSRNNKLFFTPMKVGELRWLDLDGKSDNPQFYTLSSEVLNTGNPNDEANQITRMVIALDGNGYAITNDGNHFIKFTTGKKPVITDLGNLIDDQSNNGISIHNKCTSWGGDMIADAMGKLYAISANHQVFSINIENRIATHIGAITGLPASYTTNAAAVDADGDIVVGSALLSEGYFKVSFPSLKATRIVGSDKQFNASDLANSNLLLQKEADALNKYSITAAVLPQNSFANSDKRVFPNPVTSSSFAVLFNGQKAGDYYITMTDLSGRILMTQKVNISKAAQSESIILTSKPSNGLYLLKVCDQAKQIVFTEKVIIQ
jgi:hypothetical protein